MKNRGHFWSVRTEWSWLSVRLLKSTGISRFQESIVIITKCTWPTTLIHLWPKVRHSQKAQNVERKENISNIPRANSKVSNGVDMIIFCKYITYRTFMRKAPYYWAKPIASNERKKKSKKKSIPRVTRKEIESGFLAILHLLPAIKHKLTVLTCAL